jgi:pimeloyl-ACP methyl ester carboxylesterase
MTRIFIILCGLCLILLGGYFAFSRWAIRHDTLALFDVSRDRVVSLDISVLRDSERRAAAGLVKLPVAIISQGNTVKNTEYAFLANVLAARGYLVVSIQHDLPTDVPLVTNPEAQYAGRLPEYQRAEKTIFYAVGELRKIQPNADYDHLTMVGHSNGGDISMFFAQEHPGRVRMVVTLDNLRVPCLTSGTVKILSFRSKDWKPDRGVVPSEAQSIKFGIKIIQTDAQHVDMSDRGPDRIKDSIGGTLDQFLNDDESTLPGPDKVDQP